MVLLKEWLNNHKATLSSISTSELRAKKIKELLLNEQNANKNFDLFGALMDTNKMLSEMKKDALSKEIEYAILLLNQYEKASNFDLFAISGEYNNDITKKFDDIKLNLIEIIEY